MSFAGASFAETPFASQGSLDVNIAVTGFGLTSTVGSVSVTAIANPNVSITGVEQVLRLVDQEYRLVVMRKLVL